MRGSRRPTTGTSPPDTPYLLPQAAKSRHRMARRWPMAVRNSWSQPSSPGAIGRQYEKSRRERTLHFWPFAIGGRRHATRVVGEFLAARVVIKQKQTLTLDQPHTGTARDREPPRHADGVVAAILRHVDIGRGGKCGAVADIGEAPNHAALAQFEIRAALHRLAVGEKGDRVVAIDGKPGMPVDHNPFAGRGAWPGGQNESQTGIGR